MKFNNSIPINFFERLLFYTFSKLHWFAHDYKFLFCSESLVQTVYCGKTPNGVHHLNRGLDTEVGVCSFVLSLFVLVVHLWPIHVIYECITKQNRLAFNLHLSFWGQIFAVTVPFVFQFSFVYFQTFLLL